LINYRFEYIIKCMKIDPGKKSPKIPQKKADPSPPLLSRWGGRRVGSGRPRLDTPTARVRPGAPYYIRKEEMWVSITLSRPVAEQIRMQGVSPRRFIRACIYEKLGLAGVITKAQRAAQILRLHGIDETTLPPRERLIVILYRGGLSLSEIADWLHWERIPQPPLARGKGHWSAQLVEQVLRELVQQVEDRRMEAIRQELEATT
jgi:hypothetical protein